MTKVEVEGSGWMWRWEMKRKDEGWEQNDGAFDWILDRRKAVLRIGVR